MFSSGFMFFICLNSCVEAVWVGSFALLSDCVPHRPSATLCWCHTEGLHTSNTKVWSFFLFLVIYIRACILCWFSVFRMFTCSIHSLRFSCSPSFIYRHLYYLVTWRYAIGASIFLLPPSHQGYLALSEHCVNSLPAFSLSPPPSFTLPWQHPVA